MKFILTGLGNWAPAWTLVKTGVEAAEKHGFWGVVFPDQYMWDPSDLGVDSYQGIDSTLETWIALTNLAARTTKIRLGTWVTAIPLRPPSMLAKIVSTVDLLSGGRAVLGVGAGLSQRLFEAYSQWDTPGVRVDKTREGVELILKLWTERKVDYCGHFYKAKGATLEPKPIQKPHPPLLFGGAGRRMLRLAGRFADICYIPPWNKMNPSEAREIVLAEAKRNNRQNHVRFAYAYTPLGPSQRYSREDYGKQVEMAAKSGYDYFITAFNMDAAPWEPEASTPKAIEDYLDCLLDFSANLISSYDK